VVRNVQGTGLSPAVLAISELDPYDYSTQPTGSVTQHTFTISNTGGATASGVAGSGLASPYRFEGGSFPGTTGDCTATLTAGANCTIVVEYAPVAVSATDNDIILIDYNDGAAAQQSTRDLTGIAVSPALLTISETNPYNFGTLATGSTATHVFAVDNTGGFQATGLAEVGLIAPFTFVGGAYPGTAGDCTANLDPGSSCNIEIQYSPSLVSTLDTDTIDLNYFDGVNAQTALRDLSGTAVSPALLTISESDPFDYGIVATGATLSHTFILTNTGGYAADTLSEVGLVAPFQFVGGSYPGAGGTCSPTLAPAASCDLVVEYAPTATGLAVNTLNISYFNGATTVNVDRDLQGTGATPALLTLSESDPYDFSSVTEGSTTSHTFIVTNTGSVPALTVGGSGLTAPFSFLGGSYPGTGGTCGGTINNAASCDIVVEFAPTTSGPMSDSIEITYNDGVIGQTSVRDVTGTGITPALLTLSESDPYDYGLIAAGGTMTHLFTITNSGQSTAAAINEIGLTAPFGFPGGAYPGTGGSCGATIAAGATCDIVVEFAPTVVDVYSSTINFAYDDGTNPRNTTRDIQGTAGAPALLAISETDPYDYLDRAIGSSTTHIFVVTNTGAVDATGISDSAALALPFLYTGNIYPGSGGDCGLTLASGASCNIEVAFQPTGVGTFPDTIVLDYNNGVTFVSSSRDVQGTGNPPALLTLSETDPYDYGNVTQGSSSVHTFELSNSGGVAATAIAEVGLTAPFQFVGGTFPGTGGTCSSTLTVSSTCDLVIEFAPTGTGFSSTTIDISYDSGAGALNATRDIQGTGIAPAVLTISELEPFDYGTVPIGSVNPQTFTISNTGGSSATGIAGSGLAAPFIFAGGVYPGTGGTCGAALALGGSCNIIVEYAPSSPSALDSDVILIDYNDGVLPQQSIRGIQGEAVNPALLSISETDPYNYGTLATGSVATHIFIVTNDGQFQASAMNESGIVAPFQYAGGSYPGTGGDCAATLAPSASCNLEIEYAPGTPSTGDNDSIDIAYNDGVNLQNSTRDLTGVAVIPAIITISETDPYDFGTLATGGDVSHIFTLTNTGGFPATALSEVGLTAPFQFVGGAFPGSSGNCGTNLAPSGSCTIDIEFLPTTTGVATGTISISYNTGASVITSDRDVRGTGAAPALITITETDPYDLGNITQGATTTHTFTLTNTGAVPANTVSGAGLLAPFSFLGGSYPGTGGDCGSSIANSASCTIVVEFAPTAVGPSSDTIDINYDD